MLKDWKVKYEPSESFSSVVLRWHLESPADGNQASSTGIVVMDISLRALSALPHAQSRLNVVLRFPGRTMSCPANVGRSDAIEIMLKTDPVGYPQIKCGYRISVPEAEAEAEARGLAWFWNRL